MKVGSLCSGYGGLEIALEAAFGEIDLRFVSEIDTNASKVLAHHHPNTPNLGDLTTVQWEKQDKIDVLCAGYPCQPFSVAGLRKGSSDDRAIFTYIAECISVLRPRYVLLENVAGHLTLGGISVLSTITEMGYYAKWGVVRASDSGATHKRARLFIWCEIVTNACSERYGGGENAGTMADFTRQMEGDTQQQRTRRQPEYRGTEAFNWQQYETAIRRWETITGRSAPIPVDEIGVRPVFVEWMMGLPAGYITNLGLSRSAELKMLGNGVCPQQAHLAIQLLTEGTL